ncbi:restriction endonuclease subunit S [Methylomagnum sp.]
MMTIPLGQIATMRYGKLPPKEIFDAGFPIFTGYRVAGYSREYLYEKPMLLVIARGVGGTGEVKISPPKAWITNLSIVLELDEEQADKKFMCYYLSQQSLKEKLDTGSAQAQITVNALSTFIVTIPSISIQRRIASFLSAYDDLIENNTRRIAILEEMARRIYEEWFVHFRFPGHENVRMVESELGLIPEGWGVLSFTELFDVRYGKTLPTKNLDPDGQYPVYGGGGVIGRYKDYVVPGPTCLITSRGNGSGTVWRTTEKAFVTNNSFVVTPKGKFQNLSFGFAELFAKNTPIKSVLGGAAQPQLTLDGLTSLRVIAFAANLAKTFDDIIRPLFDLATNLHHKNCNLRTTRDLLLPKLISGELDVSHLPEPLEIAA